MMVMRQRMPDQVSPRKQRNEHYRGRELRDLVVGPELVLRSFLSRKTDSKKVCADYSPGANVFCTPWRTGRDNTSWLSLSHPFSRCCALDKGLYKTRCELRAEVNLLPGLIFKLHLDA